MTSAVATPVRIAVILAGGRSKRMGGVDKATVEIGGRRLIDHVVCRLIPQTDRILISGASDYGTGCPVIHDRNDGPCGPAAGLWAAMHYIEKIEPAATGFVTAPVDGPFLPDNLYEKLASGGATAIAANVDGDHPTFAYWSLPVLRKEFSAFHEGDGLALHILAKRCKARRVQFSLPQALTNVNSPDDVAMVQRYLSPDPSG